MRITVSGVAPDLFIEAASMATSAIISSLSFFGTIFAGRSSAVGTATTDESAILQPRTEIVTLPGNMPRIVQLRGKL